MNLPESKISDEELLSKIAKNDQEAFQVIYSRHSARLFGICLAVLRENRVAQDALQEAFLAIWRGAGSFTATKGRASTWMNYLCRNRCIDMLRSRRYQALETDEKLDQRFAEAASLPDSNTHALQISAKLKSALESLPKEQKELLELAYFAGLTHSEIAEESGLPLGTIKSRLRLGMEKLRQSVINDLKQEV
ncbi:MAG: RNA polymerase sigma factor [Calditrichia bacterium]